MKQINLAEWAIKHKQIVYFFIFFILLGGIMSYFSLGRSEDPAFTIREAVVTAAWRIGRADHRAGDRSPREDAAGREGARLPKVFHA